MTARELIEAAMGRRDFLRRLGGAVGGMAVAPQMMASAAPAAAKAAPTWVPKFWTTRMQTALDNIRDKFMEERVLGFNHPKLGYAAPRSPQELVAAWERHAPRFGQVLHDDPELWEKFGLAPKAGEQSIKWSVWNGRNAEYYTPEAIKARKAEYDAFWKEREARMKSETEHREQVRQQREVRRQQRRQAQQQRPAAPRRPTKTVWPPKPQRYSDEEEYFESRAAKVVNSLLT